MCTLVTFKAKGGLMWFNQDCDSAFCAPCINTLTYLLTYLFALLRFFSEVTAPTTLEK